MTELSVTTEYEQVDGSVKSSKQIAFDIDKNDRAVADPIRDDSGEAPPLFAAKKDGSAEVCNDLPEPGTPEFAALCESLDRRPLAYRALKRAFDVAFSLAVLAVCLVPGLLLSAAIAAETKASPIYSQVRAGRRGRPFRIYKFRSMVADSDDVGKYLSPAQLEQWRRERKVDGDPRVTRVGRVLRRLSLDELPQFANVLLGQISVIGPRVITYDELAHFGADAALLLSVTPGITGAWQTGPRNEATFENGERQRVELAYVRSAGPREDLRIFFRTFGAMFAERTGR